MLDKTLPTRRFIAGAVCPNCQQIDKIVLICEANKDDKIACVACGYQDKRPSPEQLASEKALADSQISTIKFR